MISLIESGNLANTENNPMIPRSAELVGLSTDTKPTGMSVGNGWSFIEMDTGKVFFYNAEDEEWLEFAGSGGGGGQGGSNVLIANVDVTTMSLDKTWTEIHDAEFCVIRLAPPDNTVQYAYIDGVQTVASDYKILAHIIASNGTVTPMQFVTASANGYPTADVT